MRGDLSETSAADACRDLASRGISGALALDGPDGPGRIVFVDGLLTAAVSPTPRARLGDRLVGAGLLDDTALTTALQLQADEPTRPRLGAMLVERGLVGRDAVRLFVQEQVLDAMFELIGWRYGTYEFTEGRPTEIPEVPVQLSVDDALVEVARRQHEWAELSQLIPDLEAVPSFRDQGSTATASLEPDEFAVLASVDGERSIRQLANDLGYGEFEAARIVYGLALLGIVEVQIPQDEIGAALDEAFAFFSEPSGDEDEEGPVAYDLDEAVADEDVADVADVADEDDVGVEPVPAAASDQPGPPATEPEAAPAEPFPIDDDLGAILTALREEPLPGQRVPAEEGSEDLQRPAASVDDLPEFIAPPDAPPPTGEGPVGAEPAGTEPAAQEPTAAEPADAAAEAGEAGEGPAATPTDEPPAVEIPAPPQTEPRSSADVSEFLRELSRLAIEDPPPPRKEKARQEPEEDVPARAPSSDDAKKKKRGLFGWGG